MLFFPFVSTLSSFSFFFIFSSTVFPSTFLTRFQLDYVRVWSLEKRHEQSRWVCQQIVYGALRANDERIYRDNYQ